MTAARTAYWREYNRKNAEKKREQHAAFRERNREKIAARVRTSKPRTKLERLKKRFAEFRSSRKSP